MLDLKALRQNKEEIEKKLRTKEPSIDLSPLLELDKELRVLITESEELKAARNHKSKEIGSLLHTGKNGDLLMQEVKEIGEKITALERAKRY